MVKLFIIWTTFVCPNSEVADYSKKAKGEQRFFARNMYSSEYYTKDQLDSVKKEWRDNYTYNKRADACIAFMLQDEDVTDELILKQVMGMHF